MPVTDKHRLLQQHRRNTHDFYSTPASVTQALLERETFEGLTWEPACGKGDISQVLIDAGLDVVSSDLIDRGYGDKLDFFQSWKDVDNIITNPPYVDNLHLMFAVRSLLVARRKVAFMMPLSFLETPKRAKFLAGSPLKAIHIFANRQFTMRGGDLPASKCCFAWFVWEHAQEGAAAMNWIL